MSAGLAAFARGLQDIAPVGQEFAKALNTAAEKKKLEDRLAYIDEIGRYEELRARIPELETIKQSDPIKYKSLLATQGISPEAGTSFGEYQKARPARGGGTEMPAPGQREDAYLGMALGGPEATDESILAGAMARAQAAMRLGVDPKSYLDLATLSRGVVSDRRGGAETKWEGGMGALAEVSGRERKEMESGVAFERQKELGTIEFGRDLKKIEAKGQEDRQTDKIKESATSTKEKLKNAQQTAADVNATEDRFAKIVSMANRPNTSSSYRERVYASFGVPLKEDGTPDKEAYLDLAVPRADRVRAAAILAEAFKNDPAANQNRGWLPLSGVPVPMKNQDGTTAPKVWVR